MTQYIYRCLFLPVSIMAALCTDPGISFKFVCKGDTVLLFQDIAPNNLKTDITLYKIFEGRSDTIASRYFRNYIYEDKILDKYKQKVSITNETILLHDFQASDEAKYVMLYQHASKRKEVHICELVPPTLRCRLHIVEENNYLIASLNNPDYCGKPVVSVSWMDSHNSSYSSHEIIKLPAEDPPGTYKACIVGEALQCLNESSKLDKCNTFIPEYTNKNRTNCFSPDDFISICKSVADIPRLMEKTEAIVWIGSLMLIIIIVCVIILILIFSGKVPKTCGRGKESRSTDDVIVWPEAGEILSIKEPNRVVIVIGKRVESNITNVTIDIFNITKHDSGRYTATRRFSPKEILDTVLLETNEETIPNIEMDPYDSLDSTLILKCNVSNTTSRKIVWRLNRTLIENYNRYFQTGNLLYIRNLTADDEYNFYTCMESGSEQESDPYSIQIWIDQYINAATILIHGTTAPELITTNKDYTNGIYNYVTTDIVAYVDAVDTNASSNGVPTERYLVFVMLGMGIIFATVFCAFRRKKTRICVQAASVDTVTNDDVENDGVQDGSRNGNYWTIVSHLGGEMSSAIETNVLQRENLLVASNKIPRQSEYEDSIKSDDIYVSQEVAGYINPISTSMKDFEYYIHPIQSNPLSSPFSRELFDSPIGTLKRNMQGNVKSISI